MSKKKATETKAKVETKTEEKEEKKVSRTWKDENWVKNKDKKEEKKETKKVKSKPKKVIRGRVLSFNDVKGYGFIVVNYGNRYHTVGVDYRSIIGTQTLRKGQIVSFELLTKYGKEQAINVIIIEDVEVFYGTISWYDYDRNFGFITLDTKNKEEQRDIFFRGNQLYNFINSKGIRTDAEIGAKVIFEIKEAEYQDSDVAVCIKRNFSKIKKNKKKSQMIKKENEEIKETTKGKNKKEKKEEKKTTTKVPKKKKTINEKVSEKKEEKKEDNVKTKKNKENMSKVNEEIVEKEKNMNKIKVNEKKEEKISEGEKVFQTVTKKKKKRKPKYAKKKSPIKLTVKKEKKSSGQKVKERKLSPEVLGTHKGMIKFFRMNKLGGFGFIKMFDGSNDLMFYKNEILYKKNICIGDITFDIKYDEIEDNYFGENIRLLRNQTQIAVPPTSKEKKAIRQRMKNKKNGKKEIKNNYNVYDSYDDESYREEDNYSVYSSNYGTNTVISSIDPLQ